jgi:hypothetical protein
MATDGGVPPYQSQNPIARLARAFVYHLANAFGFGEAVASLIKAHPLASETQISQGVDVGQNALNEAAKVQETLEPTDGNTSLETILGPIGYDASIDIRYQTTEGKWVAGVFNAGSTTPWEDVLDAALDWAATMESQYDAAGSPGQVDSSKIVINAVYPQL